MFVQRTPVYIFSDELHTHCSTTELPMLLHVARLSGSQKISAGIEVAVVASTFLYCLPSNTPDSLPRTRA